MVEPRGLEVAADWRALGSPETYLGYAQSTGFASEARARFDRAHHYTATSQLPIHYWDLSGRWTVAQHAALLDQPGGQIAFLAQPPRCARVPACARRAARSPAYQA